jgi:hypothetical protein
MMAALVAASLAIPAVASAHPGVYTVTPQTGTLERQQIVVTGESGTWVPEATAAAVPFNATAEQVEASLEALVAIDNVVVTRTGAGPYTYVVTFVGAQIGTNVANLVPASVDLMGAGSGVVHTAQTDGTAVDSAVRYVFSNHNYTAVFNETNGVSGSGGALTYARIPGGTGAGNMRAGTRLERLLSARALGAETGVQVHATCDVAALKDDARIAEWQVRSTDPFYDYIPFQSTAAGFDDNASDWIPVVEDVTGVDLTGMDAAAAEAACENPTGLNGTYVPADAMSGAIGGLDSKVTSNAVDAATGPLNSQITTLMADKAALNAAKAALEGDKTTLSSDKATLTTKVAELEAALAKATEDGKRPLTFTPAGKRFKASASHLLTGEAGDKATVTVHISKALQKALKLKSDTIAMDKVTLDAQGAAIVMPNVTKAAAGALGGRKSTPVTVKIVSGDTTLTAKATLIG